MVGLGAPVQLAYAVDDLDAAVAQWASMGAGPFFVRRHIDVGAATVNGAAVVFDHSSAYGQHGPLMIELVQFHDAPSSVRPAGIGPHHLAYFVDSFDTASTDLVAHGWPEAMRAQTGGGVRFAFHDARSVTGHFVEIYEPTPKLREFYAYVASAAVGWDGSASLREL